MSRFIILMLIVVVVAWLTGCYKTPTYEQRRIVEDACNSVGMKSDHRDSIIRCWIND